MDSWGVGAYVGFLVGIRCECCWMGELWGQGRTGGSVGGNFGVDPCLRLYWCIL